MTPNLPAILRKLASQFADTTAGNGVPVRQYLIEAANKLDAYADVIEAAKRWSEYDAARGTCEYDEEVAGPLDAALIDALARLNSEKANG